VLSDEALGGLVASGDERAFEALYERYSAALFRYCRAILRSPDDAEEVFQATMLNAYRALSRGTRPKAMRAWLYQIAHNQCVSLIRGRRPAESLGDHEVALAGTVHEQVEIQEQMRQLRCDLDSLPPMQRSALVMREMSGLSHQAIGQALATSPSDARQLVYEARQSLAEFNAGRELACDDVRHRIADGDRRRLRGRRVRAHLRSCQDCKAFSEADGQRRRALAGFLPILPAALGAEILESVLASGGSAAGAASGSVGSTLGSSSGASQAGAAAAGGGVATAGIGLQGIAGTAGTFAGLGSFAAGGFFRAAGSGAALPSGMISTTTAGGLAAAGVAALSLIVAAAVTLGGGQAAPVVAQASAQGNVNVAGVLAGVTSEPVSRTSKAGPDGPGGSASPAAPVAPQTVSYVGPKGAPTGAAPSGPSHGTVAPTPPPPPEPSVAAPAPVDSPQPASRTPQPTAPAAPGAPAGDGTGSPDGALEIVPVGAIEEPKDAEATPVEGPRVASGDGVASDANQGDAAPEVKEQEPSDAAVTDDDSSDGHYSPNGGGHHHGHGHHGHRYHHSSHGDGPSYDQGCPPRH
jgi:RNA polymerase sigma factor (sigma-70 family)